MQQYSAVIDGGEGGETTLEAESLSEALELATEWTREGDWAWATSDGTAWARVDVSQVGESLADLTTRLEDAGHEVTRVDDMDRAWVANSDLQLLAEQVGDGWIVEQESNGSLRIERAGDYYTLRDGAVTVAIDPPEPDCLKGGEHRWRSPHDLVGGIESNPGVWGSGGGVLIIECCMRCGCARTTDTWAQDPETGEQGLTSVRYEPGRWAGDVPTPAEWELRDQINCWELRACAAYVLSTLRDESPAEIRDSVPKSSRERAYAVAQFAERAQPFGERALRLALYLAARNANELRAAEVIVRLLSAPR